jgi:hypothetical protein
MCQQAKRPTRESEALSLLLLTCGSSILLVHFPCLIFPSFGLSVLATLSTQVLALPLSVSILFRLHLLQAVLQTGLAALMTWTHTFWQGDIAVTILTVS